MLNFDQLTFETVASIGLPVESKNLVMSKERQPANYLNLLHRAGLRYYDNVLVIGAKNVELFEKMARMLGPKGTITVIDNSPSVLAALQAMVDAEHFKAVVPFSGGHPAFDMRPNAQRYAPIEFHLHLLQYGRLPFEDNQFDFVWVDSRLDLLIEASADTLETELARVAKDS